MKPRPSSMSCPSPSLCVRRGSLGDKHKHQIELPYAATAACHCERKGTGERMELASKTGLAISVDRN